MIIPYEEKCGMEQSQAIMNKWVEYPNQLYTDYDYHTDAHVAEKASPQLVNSGQFVTFWSEFVLIWGGFKTSWRSTLSASHGYR